MAKFILCGNKVVIVMFHN